MGLGCRYDWNAHWICVFDSLRVFVNGLEHSDIFSVTSMGFDRLSLWYHLGHGVEQDVIPRWLSMAVCEPLLGLTQHQESHSREALS
jgi:hypothetical protein